WENRTSATVPAFVTTSILPFPTYISARASITSEIGIVRCSSGFAPFGEKTYKQSSSATNHSFPKLPEELMSLVNVQGGEPAGRVPSAALPAPFSPEWAPFLERCSASCSEVMFETGIRFYLSDVSIEEQRNSAIC